MSLYILYLKRLSAKILLFSVLSLLAACNAVKRLEPDQNLLVKNEVIANDEKVREERILNQVYQEPNTRFLGIPLRLHFYNLARPNIDSIFYQKYIVDEDKQRFMIGLLSKKQYEKFLHSKLEFNDWLKRTGEEPVIVSREDTEKSLERLKSWYWNNGWFNVEGDYKIIPEEKEKRARVEYTITTHKPYIVDTLQKLISSPALDSLYIQNKAESAIKEGVQYNTLDFNEERDRLTELFRNNGVYDFDQEFITFDADTIDTNHRIHPTLIIKNRRNGVNDSVTQPFKIHEISKVNIFTDYSYSNRNKPISDSVNVEGYSIYSFDEMEYKAQAITDAIFIKPGSVYSDLDRTRTYNRINSLRNFKYPNIQFIPDPADSTGTDLVSNIFLSPQPKYSLGFDFDVYQSNIQKFGIGFGGSFLIRNLFGRAENFEISGTGSIGSSADAAKSGNQNQFFDITEVGADAKLSFPRIFLPFNTERIIPKYTSPFTNISLGVSSQRNIGLDKQTFSGILNYEWTPNRKLTNSLDLLNIQYVRNLNIDNYFNVYRNSFEELNDLARRSDWRFNNPSPDPVLQIPDEADEFIDVVISSQPGDGNLTEEEYFNVIDIAQRKFRLTQNNLIFATNYTYLWNTKKSLYDQEFTRFRFKIETAGNVLSAISKFSDFSTNEQGQSEIMGVAFSQYVKTEIDMIKHWDLGHENVIAVRGFGGIAIPYGNSNSIPISKTFFAGGPNDNRAWQAYDLGPGSSGSLLEFNEANMKLAFNAEYRFGLYEAFKGALFVDVGNIWNVLDNTRFNEYTFDGFKDLSELAVGSGFGIRYDFDFFVLRFDIGFKTYNPALPAGDRWFKQYNFNNAVYNVGINYPF